MPLNAGDEDCTTGLSKAIFDAILEDGRGLAPQTSARDETIKGMAFAIASAVVAHFTANGTAGGDPIV